MSYLRLRTMIVLEPLIALFQVLAFISWLSGFYLIFGGQFTLETRLFLGLQSLILSTLSVITVAVVTGLKEKSHYFQYNGGG
jgi:hypothetical protein